MLQTLKRDWWKLGIILLLVIGLDILNYPVIASIWGQLYSTASTRIILVLIISAVAALSCLIENVLPTFIHERKTLWNLAWKYIALRVLFEIFYFIVNLSISTETALAISTWIKWSSLLLAISLLLGFLCAAANEMGLWM